MDTVSQPSAASVATVPTHAPPRVFADTVGQAPLDPAARDAYLSALEEGWADPRRLHSEGRRARALLEGAREDIAAVLGARPAQTHFSPSPAVATERLVMGIAAARAGRKRVVASAVEAATLAALAHHVAPDALERVGVDETGQVDIDALSRALHAPDVAFCAVQHANREIGTIQPIDAAFAVATVSKVPLIVDATASIGPLAPPKAWDALVADPANWGGLGGFGVLALRPGVRWVARWPGGEPWAEGTIPLPNVLAAAVALRVGAGRRADSYSKLVEATERLRAGIRAIPRSIVLGHPTQRLPHLTAATFVYADAHDVARRLDEQGFAVGVGCSCGTEGAAVCPTLEAIGAMPHGTLRFGLRRETSAGDIDRLLAALAIAVEAARIERGAPS